mmetsp:Transcript_73596/g.157815  ORF Transcript_73596/g.157815 Transcript_73596/m.157815 type:complete len:247 (+) Transcript_73596:717-1457(+)
MDDGLLLERRHPTCLRKLLFAAAMLDEVRESSAGGLPACHDGVARLLLQAENPEVVQCQLVLHLVRRLLESPLEHAPKDQLLMAPAIVLLQLEEVLVGPLSLLRYPGEGIDLLVVPLYREEELPRGLFKGRVAREDALLWSCELNLPLVAIVQILDSDAGASTEVISGVLVVVHDDELENLLVAEGQHAVVLELRIGASVPYHRRLEPLEVPQFDEDIRVELIPNGVSRKLLGPVDVDAEADPLRL